MMLKIRTDAGWHFRDNLHDLQTYHLRDKNGHERLFENQAELSEAIEEMYGGDVEYRSFADELWPDFRTDVKDQRQVIVVGARQGDGTMILALLGDETYLLGDNGKTIERIR